MPAAPADALIHIQNLTRRYGRRRGIQDVTLAVPEGALFGFLGPNGAGKTTTIRVLLGFLRPTSGHARIFGQDCWAHSAAIKRDIGYVPGDLRLPAWMTGRQALAIFGAVRRRDLTAHGRDLARRFELDLSVKVRSMSRGMRQKLGLILALAHQPRLLILDEPTTGLDPLMQEQFRALLRELATRGGHTIFFSSHTLSEVEQLCDRLAIVRDGRIVVDASLEELRRKAGHEVVIRWKDAQTSRQIQPPSFLAAVDRNGDRDTQWRCTIDGPLQPLLQWLAAQPAVEDLAITRPDLETLFRRFYEPARPLQRPGLQFPQDTTPGGPS
jgi:ABC-2 type transport system ATP-binding protein